MRCGSSTACSSRPTAAHCFSTKSAICPSRCRSSCFGCCRSARSPGSGASRRRGRFPARLRDSSRPQEAGREGHVPRRPVLSRQRGPSAGAAAARTSGGYALVRAAVSARGHAAECGAAEGPVHWGREGATQSFGPATCANCAIASSVPMSSPPATRSTRRCCSTRSRHAATAGWPSIALAWSDRH